MVGWHGFGLANLVRSMPSAELRVGSAVVSSAVSLAVCAGSPSTATSTSSYDVTCSLCPSDLDSLLLLGMFGVVPLGVATRPRAAKLARGGVNTTGTTISRGLTRFLYESKKDKPYQGDLNTSLSLESGCTHSQPEYTNHNTKNVLLYIPAHGFCCSEH